MLIMAILVAKADGSKQLFEKGKIISTCLKMGANMETADAIARKIENKVYDGIQSRKIFTMISRELGRYMPTVRHLTDLRRALSLMKPKPDFEKFIQLVFIEHGYEVTPNPIIRGKCVEHELDAMARKNGKTLIIEVKHHYNRHILTGLDVTRIARAIFEDISEGYTLGLNSVNPERALVVSNTKFSDHANRYAQCRGIENLGWNTPTGRGLEKMIEDKQLFPLTYLRNLDPMVRNRIMGHGIILLKQLVSCDLDELSGKMRIPKNRLASTFEIAKMILFGKD